jgi:hypothetical protein
MANQDPSVLNTLFSQLSNVLSHSARLEIDRVKKEAIITKELYASIINGKTIETPPKTLFRMI